VVYSLLKTSIKISPRTFP